MFGRNKQKERLELIKESLIAEIKAFKDLDDFVIFLAKHAEALKLAAELAEKFGGRKK